MHKVTKTSMAIASYMTKLGKTVILPETAKTAKFNQMSNKGKKGKRTIRQKQSK